MNTLLSKQLGSMRDWFRCAGATVQEWGFINYMFTHGEGGWGAVAKTDSATDSEQALCIMDGRKTHAAYLGPGTVAINEASASVDVDGAKGEL